MRKIITGVLATVLVTGGAFWASHVIAAGSNTEGMTAKQAALDVPVGELVNPFDASDEEVVAKGQAAFRGACAACHGGTGGGGMGPPLSNQVWNYDETDDTLFRLITLGSDCKNFDVCIETLGYKRVKRETMSFPMPGQGHLQKDAPEGKEPSLKTPEDVWNIVTFIRKINPESAKSANATN